MTQPGGPQITAQQLILDLISQGRTQREIAHLIGRSEDFVSLVKRGHRPGRNLVQALIDITQNITPPPVPRRTNQAGQTVRVRAPGGTTVQPPPPRRSSSTDRPETRRTPLPGGRNQFRHDENILPGGRETHLIQMPRRNRDTRIGVGERFLDIIGRAASRGGRWQATVTYEVDRPDGTRERVQVPVGEKGGYDARGMLHHIDESDVLSWIDSQVDGRYKVDGGVIVALDMSVW
ncbi:Uncharacterised protein [Mycobacteroides abscessus subsp. abscessus]|nr:Uncharacterised protein [Mycobacteroides abscessus subsp. abscessus]